MAVDPGFLANISLFQSFDDDERALLAASMAERTVKAGDVLFKTGDPGDSMFIVRTGSVELFVKDKAGQKIVLHVAEPGEFFGELSLLDGGSRTATGCVLGEGDLWILDREDLQQLFRKRPDAALDMLAASARVAQRQRRGPGRSRQPRDADRRYRRGLLRQHHVPRDPRDVVRGVARL